MPSANRMPEKILATAVVLLWLCGCTTQDHPAGNPGRPVVSASILKSAKDNKSQLDSYVREVAEKVANAANNCCAGEPNGLSGHSVLNIQILASGQLKNVQIKQSSGNKVLDNLLINAVYVAAPFPPFSPSLSAEFDVVEIQKAFAFP